MAIDAMEKKIAPLDLNRQYHCNWVSQGPEPSEDPESDGGGQPINDSFDVDDLATDIDRRRGLKSTIMAEEQKVGTYGEIAVKLRLLQGPEWRVEVLRG